MSITISKSGTHGDDNRRRDTMNAILRGARQSCPACGQARLYTGFLKVQDACPSCGEELHHQRADDAPPYFTMFIVGHVVIAGVMALIEQPTWVHAVVWPPVVIAMSLWLLPRIKGALIGVQWANRMHGFGNPVDDPAFDTPPEAPTGR